MSIFSRQPRRVDVFDAPTTAVEDITGDYAIDTTHTRLGFSARHAMVTTVRGGFTDFEGTARIDTDEPGQLARSRSPSTRASIDTGVADRDGHLKSADFFDVENYPRITFSSTSVERDGDDVGDHRRPDHQGRHQAGHHRVRADRLGQGPVRQHSASASRARTAISRKDWGLTWNAALETGGVLVSDKVKLEFDVSAIQKA